VSNPLVDVHDVRRAFLEEPGQAARAREIELVPERQWVERNPFVATMVSHFPLGTRDDGDPVPPPGESARELEHLNDAPRGEAPLLQHLENRERLFQLVPP
jgi:hypothetical protein